MKSLHHIIKLIFGSNNYTTVLYGDVNGDGLIGDIDDIMMIIRNYLGKKELSPIEKLAANLQNNDNRLDIDDIMIMINTYLGKDVCVPKKTVSGDIKIGESSPGLCPISEVVKVGDVIQWGYAPMNVNSIDWIVWNVSGDTVSIVPANNIANGTYNEQEMYCDTFEQKESTRFKGNYEAYNNKVLRSMIRKMALYFKSDYVKEVRFPKLIEYKYFKGSKDPNIQRVYYQYLCSEFTVLKTVDGKAVPVSNMNEKFDDKSLGIRPVYVLKKDVKVFKGSINNCWIIDD